MALTEQQQQEIQMVETWRTNSAPQGLDLDENTPSGAVNTQIITSFIVTNKLPLTVESLNAAVRLEAKRFIWAPGFGPQAPAPTPAAPTPRKRDAFNTALDSGAGAPSIDPTSTHAYLAAHKIDQSKVFEERQAAEAARAQAQADERQEYADTHVQIFYEGDRSGAGRLNHSATEAAQKAGREKWAVKRGVKLAPTTVRELDWDNMTSAEKYACTPEEIKRLIAKQRKGRGY